MEDNTEIEDLKFMKEALREAEKALGCDEVPVGAVITCNGRVIARAHNLTERLCDPTAHAEMQAITMAASNIGAKYLIGCTIYVTVEPCPMCAAALHWAQISRVVYGAKDQKRGYSRFSPNLLHPKTSVTEGILSTESSSLISSFFKEKR